MRSIRVRTSESVRFSHNRRDAVLHLHEHGRRTLTELAAGLAIPRYRARAVLFGDWPEYAPEYGLVSAGIVEVQVTAFGPQFQLTDAGAFEARAILRAEAEGRKL